MMFLYGFLCCWTVMGAFTFLADDKNWVCIFEDWAGIVLTAPVLMIVFPFYLVYALLLHPWRCVMKPVERERFDFAMRLGGTKAVRIRPRFYLCVEPKAKLVNKVYFVRIRGDGGDEQA